MKALQHSRDQTGSQPFLIENSIEKEPFSTCHTAITQFPKEIR